MGDVDGWEWGREFLEFMMEGSRELAKIGGGWRMYRNQGVSV